MQVYFDDMAPPIECRSPAEVDSTLDRLTTTSSRPILVDIWVPGFIVQMGIGLDPTFVVVNTGHENDGEYVITVGDHGAEGVVDVYGCGTHSQMRCRNLVPYNLARDAVRQFVRTGTLSASVRWHDFSGNEVAYTTWLG